jgi:hypothetical protein
MAANIIISTFLMWFIQREYVLLGLIAMTVKIINSCATAPQKSFPHIPPHSESERYRFCKILYSSC